MELKSEVVRASALKIQKGSFLFRNILFSIVSAISFVSTGNAQIAPPGGSESSNGLSDEFVLERISGKQTPERISDSYAIQFLTPMLLNSDPSLIKSRLSTLGITDAQSVEIKRIANAAFFSNDRNVRSGVSDICESEEYQLLRRQRNDPQALVNLMADLEARTSEAYASFFRAEMVKTMGAEFYGNLMLWMDENIKPRMTSVKIDHVKRAAALNRDLFTNFEQVCVKHNL